MKLPDSVKKILFNIGTLVLISKKNVMNVIKIESTPPIHPTWLSSESIGKLEAIIVKFRPPKLPQGFFFVIIISAYIPEWEKKKQTSSIFQLIHQLTEVTSNSIAGNIPLIFIAGDLNGANYTPVSKAFNLRRLNNLPTREGKILDVILTNVPDCYDSKNLMPLGIRFWN